MNKENKITQSAPEKKEKKANKKGDLKALLKSRKAHHGAISVAITAVVIAIVIVLNVVCGLLVDRYPDLKLDLTANKAFALQEDTANYVSKLKKDVTLYMLGSESSFESGGTYFIQAKNLLEKMESKSNGKIKIKYVDITDDPDFTKRYPDVNWQSTTDKYVTLAVCGDNYRALTVDDCFEYDEQTYAYTQQYSFTGTTIEQAVVTAILGITTDDAVVVDMITGNQEQDYSAIKSLLEKNAYKVNEISLVTDDIDKDADFVMLYAPAVDLDESATEKLSEWLNNGGKYGKSFIYIPSIDNADTPNLDELLNEWGLSVSDGLVFETDTKHLASRTDSFSFITDYNTEYYTKNLKNSKIPVVVRYSRGIEIEDDQAAHALLTASDKSGLRPFEVGDDWDYNDAITGKNTCVAAEGIKQNEDEKASRVLVFGSPAMFTESIMSLNSFNNSAYLVNVFNTIADKTDSGITIESKSLNSNELGTIDVSTKNIALAVFVFIIPAGVLITGLVLWLRRRNR